MNPENRVCQNCNQSFTIEPDDFTFYEKIKVPPPTWCPACRLQRRLLWRNERTLYKRKCGAPGHDEEMISYIAPEKSYPVYCQKYWWSDAWDATRYGRDVDFSRPFLAQVKELMDEVPKAALSAGYLTMIRSDYSNWAGDCKDCYLVTDADYVEESGYSSSIFKSKECYDCNTVADSELCYECFNIHKCYRATYCVSCHESTDIMFSKGLVGCANCFGCINLKKKSHYIFNVPVPKGEYQKRVDELLGDRSFARMEELKQRAAEHWLKYPHKFARGIHNVNVEGDYIYHSKNVKDGFFVDGVEDSRYVALVHSKNVKDCYDYADWGDNVERAYECIAVGLGIANVKFSALTVIDSRDVEYGYWLRTCAHCFGCAGLWKKQYCILNKPYSKEEYDALLPKIIEHMNAMPYTDAQGRVYRYGEFFPPEFSCFAYNETMAQEIFPLTAETAREGGWMWRDREERMYQATKRPEELPPTTAETDDSITGEVIACEHGGTCNQNCTRAFRIIPQELRFYRKMSIPVPHLCPNCRHYERLKHRNPFRQWERTCDCGTGRYANTVAHGHGEASCGKTSRSSYAPDRPEIVYCESCYQAEVA